jgi:hypothetical protein
MKAEFFPPFLLKLWTGDQNGFFLFLFGITKLIRHAYLMRSTGIDVCEFGNGYVIRISDIEFIYGYAEKKYNCVVAPVIRSRLMQRQPTIPGAKKKIAS